MTYNKELWKLDSFNPEKRLKESLVSVFNFLKEGEEPERRLLSIFSALHSRRTRGNPQNLQHERLQLS